MPGQMGHESRIIQLIEHFYMFFAFLFNRIIIAYSQVIIAVH